MGSQSTKALQGRRQQESARLDRLIGQADQRDPAAKARAIRIGRVRRLIRRRLRALATAREAVAASEIEVGNGLILLLDEGVSRNDAYRVVGLDRHVGRRYVELAYAARLRLLRESSTEQPSCAAPVAEAGDRDPIGSRSGAADERNY